MKKLLLLCLALITGLSSNAAKKENEVVKYNGIPVKDRIEVYAHRGGRGLMPENTIPAYKFSLRLGVDYVDMDVHLTKDGSLIIAHDPCLDPYITKDSEGKWIPEDFKPLFKDMTVDEIKTYDVGGIKPGSVLASCFPSQISVDKTSMPTLKEAVDYVKSMLAIGPDSK